MSKKELENIFTFHPVKNDQPVRYQEIRNMALQLSLLISELCPESREKSLAITNLQQSVMWANASIAINE